MTLPTKKLLVSALVAWAAATAAAAPAPNILFILVDDMGWGDLGVFYQNGRDFALNRNKPAFPTPRLDTMATEGLQLRRHYCPAPVCAPSRSSLLCGVHQGHSGVRDNQFDWPLENNHTLASVLRQGGYATAAIGKYGLDGSALGSRTAGPLARGFDFFFGYLDHLDGHYHYPKEGGRVLYDGTNNIASQLDKCYTADLWTARAKKWIVDHQATNAAQPFFIYLAYDTPHAQLQVPAQPYPAGAGTNGGVQWTGIPGAMINTAAGTIDAWIHPEYANATWDSDNNTNTLEVAWPTAEKRHATMMRRLDDAVGDLMQTLKDLNCDTNTLIVFTSDNGPHNEAGNGGAYTQDPTFFDSFGPMDGIKRDTWEGGMRVPTLVRWPGHVAAGTSNFTASQFHDWLPTFAELAGLPAPARSDGVSLVPTLTGVGVQRPGTIYVEYYFAGTAPNYTEFEPSRRGATRNQEQIIHLDGFKGIRYNIAGSSDNFKIYDTLNDPKETTDLSASSSWFANLQQRMKNRVLQLRRPLASAARPYDSALVPPASTSNLVTGLDYRAFEGAFPWVPDFTTLGSVTNGSCTNVDLSVRRRQDNIGLLYTGYLDVPSDGTYTIYLATDSRAFLRLHDASVIDADFAYTGGAEVSAGINLKAGRHPLRLAYIHRTNGTPSLTLEWSGPGLARQPVPNANLLRQGAATNTPPSAVNDSAATRQNTAVVVNVLANDSLGSGPGPLRVVSVGTPLAGAAVTNLNGQVVYTPNPGFLGEDTFSYTITDGARDATAFVRIKVFFADGLIWFPFNQTSGLTTEDAGGAFTATLNGFTNDPAQWVAGKWNRAIDFNGAGYVAISDFNGILGAGNRTVAAWVKTTSAGSGPTGQPVIAWGPNTAGNKWIFLVNGGHARIEITSGYLEGTTLVNDGQWHHLACVYSNNVPSITNAKLYVDGTLETSFTAQASLAVNTTSSGNAMIGSDLVSQQTRYFKGVIDEPRIYDRALFPAEIAALASATNQSAAAWHRRYFGAAPVVWTADDDGDGGARLLEYAFGAEPWIANPSALAISGALLENRLQVSFRRPVAGTSELTYTVQVSRDLAVWNQLAASLVTATPLAAKPGFELATFQTDATTAQESAQYVRVMAALP